MSDIPPALRAMVTVRTRTWSQKRHRLAEMHCRTHQLLHENRLYYLTVNGPRLCVPAAKRYGLLNAQHRAEHGGAHNLEEAIALHWHWPGLRVD